MTLAGGEAGFMGGTVGGGAGLGIIWPGKEAVLFSASPSPSLTPADGVAAGAAGLGDKAGTAGLTGSGGKTGGLSSIDLGA